MERLTVDNPRNNREALLNYAYAKDGRVFLSYADGEAGVDLCEYVAQNACCEDIDSSAVMDGACMECDCKTAVLYTVAVQAAELRARLEQYEDMEEQGRLVVIPCKVGDYVFLIQEGKIHKVRVQGISVTTRSTAILNFGGYPVQYAWDSEVGKTVFLTLEEAEASLKGGSSVQGDKEEER